MPAPREPALPDEKYRPLNRRRRLLIVLLAVATAVTVVLMLLDPPGGVPRTRPAPAPCQPGQTENCVGGKAMVIVAPAGASAASR